MKRLAAIGCVLVLASAALYAQGVVEYQTPPKAILDVMRAPRPPQAVVSPSRDYLLLYETVPNPDIADLARPMLRIAGIRIDPSTSGLHIAPRVKDARVERISDGQTITLALPAIVTHMSVPLWAPDGRSFAFTNTTAGAIQLWVGGLNGQVRQLANISLDGVMGSPIEWAPDGSTLLCKLVPVNRGTPPPDNAVPAGPTVEESDGDAIPAPTYEDLMRNPHDEDLFDYYASSQLALVNPSNGHATPLGKPGVWAAASFSPDGHHLLVARLHRPYSYLVTDAEFPRQWSVMSVSGATERTLRDAPLGGNLPRGFIETGARDYTWMLARPATVMWVEALDDGNPDKPADYRDRVVTLAAPFSGEGTEYLKTQRRFTGIEWGQNGDLAILRETDRRLGQRAFFFNPATPEKMTLVWDRPPQSRYGDPGTPVAAPGYSGRGGRGGGTPFLQDGNYIYLTGAGASRTGDHPFFDRFNTQTLQAERLFQSPAGAYETVVAPLARDASSLLVLHESASEPPNYEVRGAPYNQAGRALTHYVDPVPQVRQIKKQLVTYKRPSDGVTLSMTVYFPPGYQAGVRYPAIVWAYPAEFGSADAASQVSGSTDRFTVMTGYSELYLALDGYVILDNMSMPILTKDGDVRHANDTYIQQLVEDATAGVNEAARLGFIDPNRVGVAGHSYGAFMTANLMAHSDLFKAGNAQSGAYNRSLTPFGFQNEERTYWDAQSLYQQMSPFNYADKIKAPILLMHGMADDNTGTFPIQSERMYDAIQGNGGTVRFVYLPYEAHGYLAQQTIEDVVYEMDAWFNKYVKNLQAPAKIDSNR